MYVSLCHNIVLKHILFSLNSKVDTLELEEPKRVISPDTPEGTPSGQMTFLDYELSVVELSLENIGVNQEMKDLPIFLIVFSHQYSIFLLLCGINHDDIDDTNYILSIMSLIVDHYVRW